MKKVLSFIWLTALFTVALDIYAQSGENLKKLRGMSLDRIYEKTAGLEPRQEEDNDLNVNDSLFRLFDVDINLALGKISFDMTWGDPVKNPRIRRDRASNLFGPVRHNADGSIRWHRGFDYYAPEGTAVYSVGNGVVSLIQNHPDFGKCVLVTHKRPSRTYYSFYAHLSSIIVEYGEEVKKGTQLGESGTTGNAYNLSGEDEHLHFEYRTSPRHGDRKQADPNAIVKTRFYSVDPENEWQSNVGVRKKKL